MRLSAQVCAALFAVALIPAAACGQSFTWTGASAANQNWSNTANWSPAGAPNAAEAVAVFDGNGSTNTTIDGAFTLGRLAFDFSTVGFGSHYLSGFGIGTGLTFNNGASASVIEMIPTDGSSAFVDVFATTVIAGNGGLDITAGLAGSSNTFSQLSLSGSITGTASQVTVNAGGQTGTVNFFGTNTYGGAGSVTTVGGGVLGATDGIGLPTNTALVLNGAVLSSLDSGTITRTLGTGDGQLRVLGPVAGFTTGSGTALRLRLGNGTGTVTWGSASFNPGVLVLGEGVTFENALALGSTTRTVRSDDNFNGSVATISGGIAATTAGLTKTGDGVLALTGTNAYTGTTSVLGGVLRAIDGQGLPANSNLLLNGGSFESIGSGTLARTLGTGAGQMRFTANGGGLSVSGGTLTVQLNGGAGLTWGQPSFVSLFGTLRFGSSSADGVIDFQNPLNLSGSGRSIEVTAPFASFSGPRPATPVAVLSGVVSNGGLTKFGDGTLVLSAANTYAQETFVYSGAVRAADGVGLPTASLLRLNGGVLESAGAAVFTRGVGTGPGQVELTGFSGSGGGFAANGGVHQIRLNGSTGSVTWGTAGFFQSDGALTLGSRTANDLTDFQNAIDLNGAREIVVVDNPASIADRGRVSGTLSNGGLTKSGPGTLELTGANSYTGATVVTAGTVRAADGGGLPAASNLTLNGGVFEGLGAVTFSRSLGTAAGQVQLATNGGGFSARGGVHTVQLNGGIAAVTWGSANFLSSGSDLLFGSATADNVADLRNDLNLGGTNRRITAAGNIGYNGPVGRLSGVVSNGGLQIDPASGDRPGTVEVTGANTYAGGTYVSGRLLVNNSTGSGTGSGFVQTFNPFGVTSPAFAATVGGSGRIAPADGNGVFISGGTRIAPGGGADNSLRIETTSFGQISIGSDFDAEPGAMWAVRVLSAGTGAVGVGSGGSSVGPADNPTNHTFLDLVTGQTGGIRIASDTVYEVDGSGAVFVFGQRYSYRIGQVGAADQLSGGPLSVTDQSLFAAVGFTAADFSLSSNGTGIFLTFTPVPEPGTVLAGGVIGLAVGRLVRRRMSRK